MIRTVLVLNALIALISCSGLSVNVASTLGISTSAFDASLLVRFNWQCWTWTITFVLSILVALALSILILYHRLSRHTWVISFTPLALFFVTLATCILLDDKLPWMDTKLRDGPAPSPNSLFLHCIIYDSDYPALYHRCVLMDVTWLSGMTICFLWLVLFCAVRFSSTLSSQPSLSVPSLRSTTHSSIQFYKYYLQDSLPKSQGPPPTPHSCIPNNSPDTINSSSTTKNQLDPSLLYTHTKSLPPLHSRFSDETLCLPIHSNGSTIYNTSRHDLDVLGDPVRPQEEKVEVSDVWAESFAPPFIAPLKGTSSSHIKGHGRSLDLGWIGQHHLHNNESASVCSRRMLMARSCPGLNDEQMTMALMEYKTHDPLLRY